MRLLGPDPIDHELHLVLAALESGKAPRDIESRIVDCKESSNNNVSMRSDCASAEFG